MEAVSQPWDYLIVTASNEAQAAAYESQLAVRRQLGLLTGARDVLVVPDPGGRRVGSGGSTIHCLLQVLQKELGGAASAAHRADPDTWEDAFRRLRVLIVHAGGDSRRLPAYGPCGKIFIPVPGESDSAVGTTLFDRQLPTYLALPPTPDGLGQVVVTAGDVLLIFEPSEVRFDAEGVIGLGCHASPEQASRHGVYCPGPGGRVRLFLQKPSPQEQARRHAVDRYGQAVLDIGVFSLDARAAVTLLQMCQVTCDEDGGFRWRGEIGEAIESRGLDFYSEVCCAMGSEATSSQHVRAARAGGSAWEPALLGRIFQTLSATPFHVQVLGRCGFLHFGTTRQIISSGLELLRYDRGLTQLHTCLDVNNEMEDGELLGADSWVEGCRIRSRLRLEGGNVVTGVDVAEGLDLAADACLDVAPGRRRDGSSAWFVRCYGVADTFKDSLEEGAAFCGLALADWLEAVGARPDDVWEAEAPPGERSLWNAAVFPAENEPDGYRRWLWMFEPSKASEAEKRAWLAAERYSSAEIAALTDQDAFHHHRRRIVAENIRQSLRRMFRDESGFSAKELAYVLTQAEDRSRWVSQLLDEAHWYFAAAPTGERMDAFKVSRILHSLGSAAEQLAGEREALADVCGGLDKALAPATQAWLESLGLAPAARQRARGWAQGLRDESFRHLGRTIVASGRRAARPPRSALRRDEIVWGRAPARLDLGGGWTDTPPYALEKGGCVINAAVDLNGQPPIHCYGRVIPEPVIRIGSIDLGMHVEIRELAGLLDYRSPDSEFALVKAALALAGFSPEAGCWPEGAALADMLEAFGGGVELTTLAAIPKGSGLGTSSIVGAVILAVVQRMLGREMTRRELFHGVLRLEQALTTGGGWQDQVGGVVDGVKVISTAPSLVPDARIQYVPADVLDPAANGGQTLLYYTGITRLAKNILQQVVGRYLDRDRAAMATLRELHALPPRVAEAMARKDLPAFGRLIDVAWRLNKQLDPNSSNEQIEQLLRRVGPHIHGAKLLGAGGGGFLLMVCRSHKDAATVRDMLGTDAANDLARFFDFNISREGLVVTVC
jgi:galactokinase/mevalonate kinase-like predicted kinase